MMLAMLESESEDRSATVIDAVMYLSHFGLREAPFTITPDPRYLYMSERHREALAHLLYGVGEGGGFVQLTGEVGTGKTTLCRALLEQLPPHVDVALILNPWLTSGELLATVCDELGVDYPPQTTSVKPFVDALYRHLLDAHARGRRTVVIVDEAQDLSAEVLEQIRLLTNLETTREKLLQIVLIGQPELIKLLEREDLRQLSQRITARYHLEPFSEEDTRAYVRHRLQVAGRTRGIFSDDALRKVHAASGGIPRVINVICDRALLGAFAHQQAHVDGRMIRKAAMEVRGPRSNRPFWARPWIVAAAGVGVAAIGGAVVLSSAQLVPREGPRAPTPRAAALAPVRLPAPPPGPASAPSASVAAATPRLDATLADPGTRSDEASAFEAIFRRWKVDHPEVPAQLGCDGARAEGLRCLTRTGTWSRLRRYNLPVVLELTVPKGTRHYAALTGLGDRSATLEVGGRSLTFGLGDVEPFWDGAFTLVWKAPALREIPITFGMRGKDVEWLRQRLAAADGQPISGRVRDAFDGELKDRVMGFQRSRSIDPDGIVGDETVLHLSMTGPEPGVPLLSAAGR
jgi:general secretion pathway protein A